MGIIAMHCMLHPHLDGTTFFSVFGQTQKHVFLIVLGQPLILDGKNVFQCFWSDPKTLLLSVLFRGSVLFSPSATELVCASPSQQRLRRSSDSVAAPSQQRCAHHERSTGQSKIVEQPVWKRFATFWGKNRGTPSNLVFSNYSP